MLLEVQRLWQNMEKAFIPKSLENKSQIYFVN